MAQWRNDHIAPALLGDRPTWLRATEEAARAQAEERATEHRLCAYCRTKLSRYNPDETCGPCQVRERHLEDERILAREALTVVRTCRACRIVFHAHPFAEDRRSRRHLCYECHPE